MGDEQEGRDVPVVGNSQLPEPSPILETVPSDNRSDVLLQHQPAQWVQNRMLTEQYVTVYDLWPSLTTRRSNSLNGGGEILSFLSNLIHDLMFWNSKPCARRAAVAQSV
jgi:hypothetical protein